MQTEIEKIIFEAVKDYPRLYGYDLIVAKSPDVDLQAYKIGYNKAIYDIQTKAPEIAKKIVELLGNK
jgi:hypothetical protein